MSENLTLNKDGSWTGNAPEIWRGRPIDWLITIPGVTASGNWTFYADVDFDNGTIPCLAGVCTTENGNVNIAVANTNTTELATRINRRDHVRLIGTLTGPDCIIRTSFMANNVQDAGTPAPVTLYLQTYTSMPSVSTVAQGQIAFYSGATAGGFTQGHIYRADAGGWTDLTAATSQVQADWTETDTQSRAYIQHKPAIPAALADLSADATHRTVTDSEKAAWNGKADANALASHVASTSNPHSVTAEQVGLGNVDNTADADKPVSTAMQTALDAKITEPAGRAASKVLGTDANNALAWKTVEEPNYPVTSVNSKTGAVTLDASDIPMPVVALVGTAVPAAGKIYTHTVSDTYYICIAPASTYDKTDATHWRKGTIVSATLSAYNQYDMVLRESTYYICTLATTYFDATDTGHWGAGTSVSETAAFFSPRNYVVEHEAFSFFTPIDGEENLFELDLTQPTTAVSFTLPTVSWKFGVPDFTAARKTYYLKFRYVNGAWEGWTTPEMSEYAKLNANNVFSGTNTTHFLNVSPWGRIIALDSNFIQISQAENHYSLLASACDLNIISGKGHKCPYPYYIYYNIFVGQGLLYSRISSSAIFGKYNATYSGVLTIGNGTDDTHRHDALVLDWDGNLKVAGNLTSVGQQISTVTATSGTVTIAPNDNKIYKYSAVASDAIAIDTSALTSAHAVCFDLLITQTTAASAITLPDNVTWVGTAPTCSGDGKTYALHIEWNGTQLVGWQKYEI